MITLKQLRTFGKKHGSAICVVLSIGGIGLTIYETWKTKPKIEAVLDEQRKKKLEVETNAELGEEEMKKARNKVNMETVRRVAVASLPIAISAGATAGLTVASKAIDTKVITDMAAYIGIKEAANKKLEEKTKEIVGEDKFAEIQTSIAQDTIKEEAGEKWIDAEFADIVLDDSYIEQAYGGDVIFFDWMTGSVFRSDKKTIQEACDRLNTKLSSMSEKYFTYNEFRTELGLRHTGGGEFFGWGVYSPDAQRLIPNMNNVIPIGSGSAVVLDWWNRPDRFFN